MTAEQARRLRKEATPAERALWRGIRATPLPGTHFRRQVPIGKYIADFACLKARVIVELDGEQHALGKGPLRDAVRTEWLESQGFLVLRFWNHEVLQAPESVGETVLHVVNERLRLLTVPLPNPPHKGEGKET